MVDPSSHNTNPPGVSIGSVLEWVAEATARDAEAVVAFRRFVEDIAALRPRTRGRPRH